MHYLYPIRLFIDKRNEYKYVGISVQIKSNFFQLVSVFHCYETGYYHQRWPDEKKINRIGLTILSVYENNSYIHSQFIFETC